MSGLASEPLSRGFWYTMRLLTYGVGVAALGFCVAGLSGCGEDNEAASRDSASKGSVTVDASKAPPPSKSMDDYFKNNPGTTGAGTAKGSGYAGAKKK
jgi:ABC-type phosphate transport system substrate-binding protein